jgi:RNA polymerase primary sigma factor
LDYRFSTYATKWNRQGVTRYLMQHNALIRVPLHTYEKIRKVQSVAAQLLTELGREPSEEEIATRCDISPERVRQLLQLNPETCSLDAPVGVEEEDALGFLLEDIQAPQPQEKLIREELSRILEELLSMLTERQRMVLRLHFGMEDGECHSLEQISIRFGVSKERVRQIERQAMDRLQKLGAGLGLEDFLE